MGVVYKARDSSLDRFVVIEVLQQEKATDPNRKRRFAALWSLYISEKLDARFSHELLSARRVVLE